MFPRLRSNDSDKTRGWGIQIRNALFPGGSFGQAPWTRNVSFIINFKSVFPQGVFFGRIIFQKVCLWGRWNGMSFKAVWGFPFRRGKTKHVKEWRIDDISLYHDPFFSHRKQIIGGPVYPAPVVLYFRKIMHHCRGPVIFGVVFQQCNSPLNSARFQGPHRCGPFLAWKLIITQFIINPE